MIVEKAVKMTAMLNLPVIGLVENMSYFKCPDCGKDHYIYGQSVINAVAAKYGIEIVEKLPIDPATGEFAPGGVAEQTAQCFENIKSILAEAGLTTANIVKTTVFLADMSLFAEMNGVYG